LTFKELGDFRLAVCG